MKKQKFLNKRQFLNYMDKFEIMKHLLDVRKQMIKSKFLTPVEVLLIKKKIRNQDFKHIIRKKMM
jgi:hypothetical protein